MKNYTNIAVFSFLILSAAHAETSKPPEALLKLEGSLSNDSEDFATLKKKIQTKSEALRKSLDVIRSDEDIKKEAEDALELSLKGYKQVLKGLKAQELSAYTKYIEEFMKNVSIILSATPGPPAAVGVFLGVAAKPTAAGIKNIMDNWGLEAQVKGLRKVEAKSFSASLAAEIARLTEVRKTLAEKKIKKTDKKQRSALKKMTDKTHLTNYRKDAEKARKKYDALIDDVDKEIDGLVKAQKMTGTVFQMIDALLADGTISKKEYNKLVRVKLLHRFDEKKIYLKHQLSLITEKMISIQKETTKKSIGSLSKDKRDMLITLTALLAEKKALLEANKKMKDWYQDKFTD